LISSRSSRNSPPMNLNQAKKRFVTASNSAIAAKQYLEYLRCLVEGARSSIDPFGLVGKVFACLMNVLSSLGWDCLQRDIWKCGFNDTVSLSVRCVAALKWQSTRNKCRGLWLEVTRSDWPRRHLSKRSKAHKSASQCQRGQLALSSRIPASMQRRHVL
jgi:hypothetical protein